MLFSVFNAFMILVLATGLVAAYRYQRDKRTDDASISAFVAIVCGSIFCAYIAILGVTAAFNELFGCIERLFSAFKALLSH